MLPVEPATYALFLSVMGVMAVTPGPANLFAVATGLQRGPRAALLGVAGMNAATLVWYLAASLGLGAFVAAFPQQFRWLAILGGLYVAWLGAKSLWAAAKNHPEPLAAARAAAPGAAFRDGFAVQIANPKAILFFTAVLPPFLDPQRPLTAQLIAFGAATLILDVAAMSAYGIAGGALAERMGEAAFRRAFAALVGLLLLIAAILIFLPHEA